MTQYLKYFVLLTAGHLSVTRPAKSSWNKFSPWLASLLLHKIQSRFDTRRSAWIFYYSRPTTRVNDFRNNPLHWKNMRPVSSLSPWWWKRNKAWMVVLHVIIPVIFSLFWFEIQVHASYHLMSTWGCQHRRRAQPHTNFQPQEWCTARPLGPRQAWWILVHDQKMDQWTIDRTAPDFKNKVQAGELR